MADRVQITKARRNAGKAKPWSHEDDRRLQELAELGYTQREVANLMGKTKNQIAGRAHRLGLRFG